MEAGLSFGRWLKQRRKTLALTQEELAHLISCSVVNVRKIESDERRPSPELAELLALHLSIAPNERSTFVQWARGEYESAQLAPTLTTAGQAVAALSWCPPRHPTNLTLQLTPLIGRDQEVATLRNRLIRGPARLLTLVGPGGVGKTRLALEVAASVIDEFADGVFLVALDVITHPEAVAAMIAQTLGLVEGQQRLLRGRLLAHLSDKHVLLVLDNFEQVVAAAPFVSDLLAACPWLQVLVTSRAPLQVRGERQFIVPPLALPPDATCSPVNALQYGAVALFVSRARSAKPGWTLDDQHVADVVALCTRLDGLPLAIELAAARCRLLATCEILLQLTDQAVALGGGFRELPERQQTLYATIDWSYRLLDPPAQQLLERLSVFSDGCTLDAVQAVCSDLGQTASTLFYSLQALIDQSLGQHEETQDGTSRFVLLHIICEYARDKLQARGQERATEARHVRYFLQLAEGVELHLRGPAQMQFVETLEREHGNLQAALECCWNTPQGIEDGLRLAGALGEFWFIRSYLSVGLDWLTKFLSRPGPVDPAVRVKALRYAGVLASAAGDFDAARQWDEEGLMVCRSLGDQWGTAYASSALGDVLVWHAPNPAQGRALLEHGLSMAYTVNDPWLIARAAWRLGMAHYYSGHDPVRAKQLLSESLRLARSIGDTWGISNGLPHLGNIAWAEGNYGQAQQLTEEALVLARAVGNKRGIANALNVLGIVAAAHADFARARSYHHESLVLAQAAGLSFQRAAALYYLGRTAVGEHALEEAKTWFAQSLIQSQGVNDLHNITFCLIELAGVADEEGQPERGVALLGAATAHLDASDIQLQGSDREGYDQMLTTLQARLNAGVFATMWREGHAMALEQAIHYAMGG